MFLLLIIRIILYKVLFEKINKSTYLSFLSILEILKQKKKTKRKRMKANLNCMRTMKKLHLSHQPNHTNVQYVLDLLYRKSACKITCGHICPKKEDSMESLFYDLNMFIPQMVYFTQIVITIRPAISSVQSAVKRFLQREI